ncbi:hypothetical protein WOLCODRAFT_117404 [Wolfiporia cocos MD-104 SS10]|uniref:SWI/SNF and RSC complexes subunit Ssr4 N-terminal domain-containing protein n=1 Tax=Wolfiporia cocos (strain MD-104) TaxID=742152 RepID=A0A2H3JE69_WOLCO|nr:hypothetical protein WOLCODRAFT_117404 [Wolfiporia cocos MD-104 SS10]
MAGHSLPEGICLRYPEHITPQLNLAPEAAVQMLLRATQLAMGTPFQWGYIDKPSDGQIFLIFITANLGLPPDGIRYLEQEQKGVLQAGPGRELEMMEVKFGFIPGQDTAAYRVRRRYRLIRGGHPQLVLIHYGRGQATAIPPSINQPVRAYPLRPFNEPGMYVMGEKAGQKVYPPGMDRAPGMAMGFPAGMAGNPQAMLAQQNSNMEALERRQRGVSVGMSQRQPVQQRPVEDDDSADESETVSTRTLAATRFRRNHEYMWEVFTHAAFSKLKEVDNRPPPYSIFNQEELEAKVAKLSAEVEELEAKAAARRRAEEALQSVDEMLDVPMDALGAQGEGVMT